MKNICFQMLENDVRGVQNTSTRVQNIIVPSCTHSILEFSEFKFIKPVAGRNFSIFQFSNCLQIAFKLPSNCLQIAFKLPSNLN
jgi:hypothetical protein